MEIAIIILYTIVNMTVPTPILESGILNIKSGQATAFKTAFKQAEHIVAKHKGYISHSLQQCIENDHQFILLIYWETLEDHTIGFRQSTDYAEWKKRLHHFYDPFPTIHHYNTF